MGNSSIYFESIRKQFEYYKILGEKTMSIVSDDGLFWQYNEQSNSIAIIVSHLSGNMLSRWTDFLTTDGEKEWRDRDAEFEEHIKTRDELMTVWERGWSCLFTTLDSLTDTDLAKTVYIRNLEHSVADAINRQLAHYPYHIGQIVFIGKMLSGENWHSLSIPKGQSVRFNKEIFSKPQRKGYFTDEYLKDKK